MTDKKDRRPGIFSNSRLQNGEDIKVLVFLAGATALFFWPIWLDGYRTPWGGGDIWGQLHPVWNYVSEWLRRGVFPLWSTRMMAGDPIMAEQQYGLFNPLNWPMFLFSPIPPWVISTRIAFSLWLAGAGLYLYLRHSPAWKLTRTAAVVGALAYMFSDPFLAHFGHPQFNDTLAWLPWVLWGVDNAMRHTGAIPPAGLALGMLVLAGHGQAALYAALMITAYAVWQVLESGNLAKMLRRVGRLALMALVGVCLAAPAVLPGLERLPYTERALTQESVEGEYQFQPQILIDSITPHFHGRGVKGYWATWNRVENAYTGIAALVLAVLGILANLDRRRTWGLLGGGILVYLFALGHNGPLYPIVEQLPLFSASWKTARIIYLLTFMLSTGAALGIDTLQRMGERPRHTRYILATWAGFVIVCAVVLWVKTPAWVLVVPLGDFQAKARSGMRFAALVAGVTGMLGLGLGRCNALRKVQCTGGRFRCNALRKVQCTGGKLRCNALRKVQCTLLAGVIVVVLGELVANGARADIEKLPRAEENPHAAAITYLKGDTGWFRVDVDSRARGKWSPAAVMAEGFEVPQGTGNPMEIAAFNQFYWAIPTKGWPAYQLLGGKFIAVPKDAQPGGEGIWPVFSDDPLIDLHLNTNALPRAWLVTHTIPVGSIEEAYSVVLAEDFVPTQVATVENGPALDTAGQGTIEVLAYGPNRAAFRLNVSDEVLLVLSDLMYPGWSARLDGQATLLYKTDGIFRGVVVPEGEHVVEMRFFPKSLRLGMGLWGMAVLVIIGLTTKRFIPLRFTEI